MSKSRRKKKTKLSLWAALSVMVVAVAFAALLVVVFVSNRTGDDEMPGTTSNSIQYTTPLVTSGGETSAVSSQTTAPDAPVTPSVTTTTPEPVTTTVPVVPEPTVPVITTEKTPETTPIPSVGVNYDYHIDMNIYEDSIDPTGDLWDDAYLLMVNANNPIAKDAESGYEVLSHRSKFSSCSEYSYSHMPSLYINDTALKALTAMFLEAEAQGIKTLDVTSAYRNYAKQSSLFTNNCNKTYHWMCDDEWCAADWIHKDPTCPACGKKSTNNTLEITQAEKEAQVATYSCAPGTSDHQTGLAVDIIQRSLPSRFDALIQEFGETEAGKWLAENARYFGFVLRFPEDKENITGIIYEPWHFRYVGRTHAMAMYEKNLCLEEYVEYLNSIGYFN